MQENQRSRENGTGFRYFQPTHHHPTLQLAAIVLLSLNCHCTFDECKKGEEKCEGDVALRCVISSSDAHGPGNPYIWYRRQCISADNCKVIRNLKGIDESYCTLSITADPICKNVNNTFDFCYQEKRVACWKGYRVFEKDCESGTKCVNYSAKQDSFCALSNKKDPLCMPENYTNIGAVHENCDGNKQISCKEEYKIGEKKCLPNMFCVTYKVGDRLESLCSLSEKRDPNCPKETELGTYCSGNTLIQCSYGYPSQRVECTKCGILPPGLGSPGCI